MNISSTSKHLLVHWLPMVTVITVVVVFVYVAVQQVYRTSADQPQTDTARVLVEKLLHGAKASDLVGTDTINFA